MYHLCVIGCGSKDGYLKHTCYKEIGLCAQKLLTGLGSIVNKFFFGREGGGGRPI